MDTPAHAEQHGCCCTSLLYSGLSGYTRTPEHLEGNAWVRDARRLDQSCSRLPWPRGEGSSLCYRALTVLAFGRRRHRRLLPPFGLDCDAERAWSGARRNRAGAIRHFGQSLSCCGVHTEPRFVVPAGWQRLPGLGRGPMNASPSRMTDPGEMLVGEVRPRSCLHQARQARGGSCSRG